MSERARDRPEGRTFYSIHPQPDGTTDVYLRPEPESGAVRVMRGVVPWDGMECDIRARYDAWCESAEEINL